MTCCFCLKKTDSIDTRNASANWPLNYSEKRVFNFIHISEHSAVSMLSNRRCCLMASYSKHTNLRN